MTRRLILRDWEASAWHAGRLSAVVRLCPKANFDPAGNLPADAVHLDGTGQGWIAWWGGAPTPETTARIYPIGGFRCPLGPPGQRLWIAETWGTGSRPCHRNGWVDGLEYKADCDLIDHEELLPLHQEPDGVDLSDYASGWRSPATMPQWASRSTAVHLGSRLVRVQELAGSDDECVVRGAYDHGQSAWDANVWVWLHRIRRETQ